MFKMSFFFLAHPVSCTPSTEHTVSTLLSHILLLLIVDMMSCDLAEDTTHLYVVFYPLYIQEYTLIFSITQWSEHSQVSQPFTGCIYCSQISEDDWSVTSDPVLLIAPFCTPCENPLRTLHKHLFR